MKKVIAGIASAALALGLTVAVAPAANAVPSASAINLSTGWVAIERDDGVLVWLAGYGATIKSNANWLVVFANSCVSMDGRKYCAGPYSYDVRIGSGQHSVRRIS